MVRLDQKRSEIPALARPATDGKRTERHAVIALAPCDKIAPLRLVPFDEILTGELESSLNCLRTTANVKDVIHTGRGMGDEIVGQFLRHLRGEEAGMRVDKPVELLAHGR